MFILQANNILKQYGVRTVLDFESIQVYEGDKIGIVGRNGAGKTTLMNILSGEDKPDRGKVTRLCEAAFIRQLPQREGTLSGGENAKRKIQQELGRENTIVFADEPTANLDAEGVEWVRGKLRAARTVLLISHDRQLLNDVCNKIVEVRDGKLYFYTGTYNDFQRQAEEQKEQQQLAHEQYKHKKAQLEKAVQAREQQVARQRQKKKREYATNLSEARLGGHKRAASMKKQEHIAKVLEGRLERLEQVDRVKDPPKIHLDFSLTKPPEGKTVIHCEGLRFAYGKQVIFSGADFVVPNGAKVAVTGRNGSGKSTLLRLIMERNPAIRLAPKLRPGFLYQGFENLEGDKTVLDNVLSTSIQDGGTVRGVLAGLLFRGDDVYKKVEVLSGGEKMRLSLAKLITGESNALLLDEPTNYLDIGSMEAVERVLKEYPGTLLVVSHDRKFVEAVTDRELRIEGGKVTPVSAAPPPDPAQKTLLELRRVRLLTEISSAPPDKKTELERQLCEIVDALKAM